MSTVTSIATRPHYKKIIAVKELTSLSKAKNETRAMLVNLILDKLMPRTGRTAWKTNNAQLIRRLTKTPDLAYLQRVLDLAELAGENEKYDSGNIQYISAEAKSGQRHNLNIVHANKEFLPECNYDMSQFAFVVWGMNLNYDSTALIPTLPAHFLAYRNYGFIGSNDEVLFGCHGYGTTQLSKLVEKFPGMVKLILDYRDMVGTTDITETGFKAFSAKHTDFTPEQEQAIWQTRSNRTYNNATVFYRAFPNAAISRAEWEQQQNRDEIMALR